jgi:hypothetical protein
MLFGLIGQLLQPGLRLGSENLFKVCP